MLGHSSIKKSIIFCVSFFTIFTFIGYANTPQKNKLELKLTGGIAFEYDLSKKVAIVIEGFEGSRNQNDTNNAISSIEGKYYTHERLEWTDEWLTRVGIGSEPPSGEEIRNARDYAIDFSGFTVRLGLKIKLF